MLNANFQPATDDPVVLITAQGKAALHEYLAIPADIVAYEIRPFDVVGRYGDGGFFNVDWIDSFCEESEAQAFIEFFKGQPDCPYSSLEISAP